MYLHNKYQGKCLYCQAEVKEKKGVLKLANPQKWKDINKKRITPRKYGVLCVPCFDKYYKLNK